VLERGLQRDANFEKNWPDVLGTLVDADKKGGVAMITTVEVERFSLTSSRPFDKY